MAWPKQRPEICRKGGRAAKRTSPWGKMPHVNTARNRERLEAMNERANMPKDRKG